MRSSKLIRYLSELAWFDIEQYLHLNSNSPSWWRDELAIRKIKIERFTLVHFVEQHPEDKSPLLEDIRKLNESIRASYSGKEFSIKLNKPPIDALRAEHVGSFKKIMPKPGFYTQEQLKTYSPHENYPSLSFLNTPTETFIKVDLEYPDTALIEAFKQHLSDARNALETKPIIPTKITHQKMKKLYEYKVLAILDLRIWELEHNVRIKKSTLAAKVFDGSKGEKELIESVLPFVDQACTPAFLESLSLLPEK
ncbi:DUF6387 family protein [Neptuniibacter caesariensis]|uniref:Uncharacterized protein n=1 Tax=Neptuniibacter caesariensis TaxID=207954 RepID=A0A7U8GTX5_NEPCE|nr:DUF6387 family protein [Neptuniibacter caesariensis]EAR62906.1 hypothetical protein MED92_07301 [Oceanospirillum sp. MED92] [Neptuniibacter caesariensis]